MAAASKYFQALFGTNFVEGERDEICLEGIDGPILKLIIEFCYSGRITICEERVFDILTAASSMELVEREQRCNEFYESNLSTKNLVTTLSIADKFSLEGLKEKALNIAYDNFADIPIDEIQKLDEHLFREILDSNELLAEESFLFERLMQWLNKDRTTAERLELAPDMLKAIRLQHIPAKVNFIIWCLH